MDDILVSEWYSNNNLFWFNKKTKNLHLVPSEKWKYFLTLELNLVRKVETESHTTHTHKQTYTHTLAHIHT